MASVCGPAGSLRFESSSAGHRQGRRCHAAGGSAGDRPPLTPQHPLQALSPVTRPGRPRSGGGGVVPSQAGRQGRAGATGGSLSFPRRPPTPAPLQEPAASTRRKVTLLSLKSGIEQPELTV